MEAIATATTTTANITSSNEELKATKYASWKLPFEWIVIDRPNVRDSYDEEKYQALKESIRENGVQQAITVRKIKGENKYSLSHGFTRYRAVKELREEGVDIPKILAFATEMNEEEELLFHITANSGAELTQAEVSKILVQLSKYGYTNKDLAKKLGYSEMKVSNLLAYQNKTAQAVKNYVAEGVISVSTATEIARQASSLSEQTEMIENVIKEKEATGKAKTVSLKEVTKKVKFDANARFGELIEKTPEGELKESLTNLYYLLNDSSLSVDDILAKIAE
jgi:ParB family chromosome partitioning protein